LKKKREREDQQRKEQEETEKLIEDLTKDLIDNSELIFKKVTADF